MKSLSKITLFNQFISSLLFFLLVVIILQLVSSSTAFVSPVTSPFVYTNNTAVKERKEAKALLKWKTSLHIKSQSLLSSWAGSTPCNWVRINCDNSGSVTHLNLSTYGLREMKLLMDLCKQMNVEMGNPRKLVPKCQGLSSGNMPGKGNQEGKQPVLLQAEHFMNNSAENKPPTIPFSSEKQASSGQLRGSYILGERMNGITETLLLLAKPALPNSTYQTWHM